MGKDKFLQSRVYEVTNVEEDDLVYLSLREGHGILLLREQLGDIIEKLEQARRGNCDGKIVWSTLDALHEYDDDDIDMIAAHHALR